MGVAARLHARLVAGPVAGDHLLQLLPVDRTEVVVAPRLVPGQVRIGHLEAQVLGLGHRHVDELLAQVVVGDPLDAPAHGLRRVRRILVAGSEHHQRRPPPAVQRILGHGPLFLAAARQGEHDLVALALVKALLLADPDHRPGIGPVRAAAERDLVHDRGAVDQPADRPDVRPGGGRIVEDAGVLGLAAQQLLDQLGPGHAQGLGGAVEIEAVAGLVLDLREQHRLAPQARRPGDPVALRQHADDFRVGVLRDLPDQGLAVALRHPVLGLDPLVAVDPALEVLLRLGRPAFQRNRLVARLDVQPLRVHARALLVAVPRPKPTLSKDMAQNRPKNNQLL